MTTRNGGVETTIDRGKNKAVWENKYRGVRFDTNSSWTFLTNWHLQMCLLTQSFWVVTDARRDQHPWTTPWCIRSSAVWNIVRKRCY